MNGSSFIDNIEAIKNGTTEIDFEIRISPCKTISHFCATIANAKAKN